MTAMADAVPRGRDAAALSGKVSDRSSMAVCRRCGSIRTQVIRGKLLERLVALLLGQRVIFCGRCGWQGRLSKSADTSSSSHRRRRRHHRRQSHEPVLPPINELDLEALDRGLGDVPPRRL
jgi:hypothetical protein